MPRFCLDELGIMVAMIFANVAPHVYNYYLANDMCHDTDHGTGEGKDCVPDRFLLNECPIFGHRVTLHFVANDMIM
jgi:hypothetical protein